MRPCGEHFHPHFINYLAHIKLAAALLAYPRHSSAARERENAGKFLIAMKWC
ncbi:MAG: hypothetical protein JSS20_09260 [Proteobacteria bacterium]|nr:hypothetical protein [Pseudomonadota bacterium]